MIGILVGQGMTFDEAISKVEDWETSGISKLLDKSKMTQSKWKNNIIYLQNVKKLK